MAGVGFSSVDDYIASRNLRPFGPYSGPYAMQFARHFPPPVPSMLIGRIAKFRADEVLESGKAKIGILKK
ncbi:MAG TPA: hypothetical protein VHB50_01015, partial [Bryobacteraceae bacterium]|nr:hypothetical protein [Bryobacteraceae bacterium]